MDSADIPNADHVLFGEDPIVHVFLERGQLGIIGLKGFVAAEEPDDFPSVVDEGDGGGGDYCVGRGGRTTGEDDADTMRIGEWVMVEP